MDQLKRRLRDELSDRRGSVSAAIYRDGSTEFYNYGTDDPDEHSLYEIGSITKVFTALLLLILEDRGEIDRSDRTKYYLPEVDFNDAKVADIKLEQLALHCSGLPRLPDNMPRSNPADPYADYTKSHLYSFLSNHTLDRESVDVYEYSNVGYGLLGHILELASGKAYTDLVREEIFRPLNMRSSFVNQDKENDSTVLPGHNEEGKEVPNWHLGALMGAGGIISTPYDMSLFQDAYINPSKSTLGQYIKTSQEPIASSNAEQHGFGWTIIYLESGNEMIWQRGQTRGFQSFIGFTPEEEFGTVILANCQLDLDEIAAETFGLA